MGSRVKSTKQQADEVASDRDLVDRDVILQLIADLRSPPKNFPTFDMSCTYELDDNGVTRGDVCSYLAARALTPEKLLGFYIVGGDVMGLAAKHANMSGRILSHLIQPPVLMLGDFPLSQVSSHLVADAVEQYMRADFVHVSWYPALKANSLSEDYDEGDSRILEERYSTSSISQRVSTFVDRYSDE